MLRFHPTSFCAVCSFSLSSKYIPIFLVISSFTHKLFRMCCLNSKYVGIFQTIFYWFIVQFPLSIWYCVWSCDFDLTVWAMIWVPTRTDPWNVPSSFIYNAFALWWYSWDSSGYVWLYLLPDVIESFTIRFTDRKTTTDQLKIYQSTLKVWQNLD